CERLEITGFPTFEIGRGDMSARLNGWQPWEVFEDVLRKVDPDLVAKTLDPTEASVAAILQRFGRCATREVAAVLGVTDDDAEILLEELEGSGKVTRRTVGTGLVWERRKCCSAIGRPLAGDEGRPRHAISILRTSPAPSEWNASSMKFWIAANIEAMRSGSLSELSRDKWTRGVPPASVRYTCSMIRWSGCGIPATGAGGRARTNSFAGHYPPR